MASIPEMVDSVNVLIINRCFTIEDISEQLVSSVGTVNKMMVLLFLMSVIVGFHQDNARRHTAARTVETNSQLG